MDQEAARPPMTASGTRRTWLWVVIITAGVFLVALVGAAGGGIYFVMHHIRTERSSDMEAMRAFDAVRAEFKDQRPLYEMDSAHRPTPVRPLIEVPSASRHPRDLRVLAWDPEQRRLVNVTLPFWMLRFGSRRMRVTGSDREFELDRLNLDPDELARIGPALVVDFRNPQGVRVLLWTE